MKDEVEDELKKKKKNLDRAIWIAWNLERLWYFFIFLGRSPTKKELI